MKKEDLRTKRTRKMILEAFINLVEEKGYEHVTVSDIASQAMINRATFYAHFKDKQDVYDYIFKEAVSQFMIVLAPVQLGRTNQLQLHAIEQIITHVFEKIQENRVFFKTVLNAHGNEQLRQQISQILRSTYANIFEQVEIREKDFIVPIDFIIEYMSSTFMASLHWWINQEISFSPKQMAQLIIKLVGSNHLKVLGIQIKA
ncbi:TetR/AcrR family transcriptional regulator [Enterococcus cecorum]|uniref:TetR/AcrR family transcriptional regulator n=1 Tax=Enterococcus cecorum TaxID=44008 RepID=UPI00200B0442|nr:TetR/AcrR family transcriptional regulator [Enterococcus cecorum]